MRTLERERCHELIWALLVLAQHWLAEGRPVWGGQRLGSFESWSGVIGGVLETAGIEGFLGNRHELYRRADEETEEWRTSIAVWWEHHGEEAVNARDLYALAKDWDLLPSVFATAKDGSSERGLKTRLGKALRQREDRRFGDFFVRSLGQDGHQKTALYRLEPAEEVINSAGLAGPEFNAKAENVTAEEKVIRSANEVPHVPQPDTNSADFAAGPVRDLSIEVPQEVPHRCPGCRLPMSVARLNDVCGRCQAWGSVPREVVLNGRRG